MFDVGKSELHGSNNVTFGNVRQAEQRRQVGRVETKKNNNDLMKKKRIEERNKQIYLLNKKV